MKKIEYKSIKWEKRKVILIENCQYYYNKVDLLKRDYLEGKNDEIDYHYTKSLFLRSIAEIEFVQGHYKECYERIVQALNEFVFSIKLLNEGKDTHMVTKTDIERKIRGEYFGYIALIVGDYDALSYVVKSDSTLYQMMSKNMTIADTDNVIEAMKIAILKNDSVKFEEALAKRIQEIRRFRLDNYICMDVWSMGLVREAQRVGMTFYADYVEVDMKEI